MALMQEYNMSAEMLFVLKLIFNVYDAVNSNDNNEIQESRARFKRYFLENYNVDDIRNTLKELMKRKILKTVNIPDDYPLKSLDAEKFGFNENFQKSYRRFTYEMGRELWDAYPKLGYINDKEVPLTSLKTFNSEEELFTFYVKSIKHDENKHLEILKLIEWSKTFPNSFINMNIESFVKGRVWDAIEEFKESGNIGFESSIKDFAEFL